MSPRLSSRKALLALMTASSLVLASCAQSQDNADGTNASSTSDAPTIDVVDNNGAQAVPSPPANPASLDNRSFEVLEAWGVELVAAPQELIPDTIGYSSDENILNIGNHREPDLEMLTAAEPDLIVNGQRFEQYTEDIQRLNPDVAIVDFEPREGEPFDEEMVRQVTELGKIFQKEEEAQQLISDFEAAKERARQAYDPEKKVMAVNVSGGTIGYIAPGIGRVYGPIMEMVGMTPALEVAEGSANHEGDDISVEAIAASNPDWIMVLDRDAAVEESATPAKSVIEGSQALQGVTAVKEGNVLYAPGDTYTNESIITYTEILNQIADAFEAQQ